MRNKSWRNSGWVVSDARVWVNVCALSCFSRAGLECVGCGKTLSVLLFRSYRVGCGLNPVTTKRLASPNCF